MAKKEALVAPQRHSNIVGGSTAARVLNCPRSVSLVSKMPFKEEDVSSYAKEGSMLHAAIAEIVIRNITPEEMAGFEFEGLVLTEDLIAEMLVPAVAALDNILDELEADGNVAQVIVEQEVTFGDFIPDAFGSCDILLRAGSKAVVLDWKFGRGVSVSVEHNEQLMFYACAAKRTPELKKFFAGVTEFELIIVQPADGDPSRWTTDVTTLTKFENDLKVSVRMATTDPDHAQIKQGKHCRWCKAKATCPLMNGAMGSALALDLKALDVTLLGLAVEQSYLLESFIEELRALVHRSLEEGLVIPGVKLVQKRATRKWVEGKTESDIENALLEGLPDAEASKLSECMYKTELLSVSQMEKVLKKEKMAIPEGLVISVSSGTTLALESDKRPSVTATVNIAKAFKKISTQEQ